MSCQNIRFGFDNIVPRSSIASSIAPINDLTNLGNEHRGRQVVWPDPATGSIVITGELPEQVTADFIAIPNHNLKSGALVLFELFENGLSGPDILNMEGPQPVSSGIPLGVWSAGVHVYGGETDSGEGSAVVNWFEAPLTFRFYRVTIFHGFPSLVALPAGVACQNPVSGFLTMDSSDAVTSDADGVSEWVTSSDAAATEGSFLENVGGGVYTDHATAPKITFTFRATRSGLHDFYIRFKRSGGSFANVSLDDEPASARFYPDTDEWEWHTSKRFFLVKGQTHRIEISSYNAALSIDKLVIQPLGLSPPTGLGPERSVFGYVATANRVELRMLYIGRKLMMDKNFSFGNAFKQLTDADMKTSAAGFALTGRAQSESRRISLTLDHMTDADNIGLAMMERHLLGRPFIVSARPGSAEWQEGRYTMMANFDGALNYTQMLNNAHQTSLNLLES